MWIKPDHELLQYSGRIDFTDPLAPVWVFPCTSVAVRFTGTSVKVKLENHHFYWDNYMGYFLDGKQGRILLPESGQAVLTIGEGLENKVHELLFFKRMDACHMVSFYGFEVEEDAEIYPLEEKPSRRIEVYGDSVSAGEVSEAVEYAGKEDPEHNGEYSNSWYSYAWITARKLNAQIHDIAQGGIALLDGTGWFAEPEYRGMESCYDKIIYHPEAGQEVSWDFRKYRPHLVIVAIGQNDSHLPIVAVGQNDSHLPIVAVGQNDSHLPVHGEDSTYDYMAEEPQGSRAQNWREHYRDFIKKLREIYPRAEIILQTTILAHSPEWDTSIETVYRQLREQDKHLHHFKYSQNGCGTKGHIRIPEAEQMAEELTAFIQGLGEDIWQEEQEESYGISD